jgi:hypothetical protein
MLRPKIFESCAKAPTGSGAPNRIGAGPTHSSAEPAPVHTAAFCCRLPFPAPCSPFLADDPLCPHVPEGTQQVHRPVRQFQRQEMAPSKGS